MLKCDYNVTQQAVIDWVSGPIFSALHDDVAKLANSFKYCLAFISVYFLEHQTKDDGQDGDLYCSGASHDYDD